MPTAPTTGSSISGWSIVANVLPLALLTVAFVWLGRRAGTSAAATSAKVVLRDQTLNQMLAETDGFDPATGIVVIAATNRPEARTAADDNGHRGQTLRAVDRARERTPQ